MIKTSYVSQIQALKNILSKYLEENLEDFEVQTALSDTLYSYSRLVDSTEERELETYLLNSSVDLHGISSLTDNPDEYRKYLISVIDQLTAVLPD